MFKSWLHKKRALSLKVFISYIIAFFPLPPDSFSGTGTLVFNDTILHEIKITFGYSNWYDSLQDGYRLTAADTFDVLPEKNFLCNMFFDGIALDSIGMRERGNFSNISSPFTTSNGMKKPFKLVFDAFKEQSFDGLKTIHLNNGTDDPGFVREPLVYKLLRENGIPASRTAYAKLYINDIYWGLYEVVEPVNKAFLKRHFGGANNDGNLYKTNHYSKVDLMWLGEDYLPYNKQGLVLKTNRDKNDWNHLIHFIYVINHTPSAQMEEELNKVFDVESYLRILAIETLCYSWDSYWGIGNNFYLYEHPDGKIRWVPWDFNETFTAREGILGALLPRQSDVFLSTRFDVRPLLKAVFSVTKWQERYMEIICNLCTDMFLSPKLTPTLTAWQKLIRQALVNDTNKLAGMEQFDAALTTDTDYLYQFPGTKTSFNIKAHGLLPYITRQRVWAIDDLKKQHGGCPLSDIEPHAYPLTLVPNPVKDNLVVSWDFVATDFYQLQVYNYMGAIVKKSQWLVNDAPLCEWNVSELPKGFYILKKQDADGFWGVAKFIKQE